ncbi:probable pre-mRNA-splicing factor ATP-dependent RNA helicase DEAH4, partial [Tanacetum coccineum]
RHFCGVTAAESLQHALKQLFLIDAINANGTITKRYGLKLPLEPSLARTLIEENKNDCLPQALTVAAMLSVEGTVRVYIRTGTSSEGIKTYPDGHIRRGQGKDKTLSSRRLEHPFRLMVNSKLS